MKITETLPAILWSGPSQIDGAPIMLIATINSANVKTGSGLVQTWILRSDMSPLEAIHSGSDSSICGDCVLRGSIENGRNVGRACYVLVHNAPRSIYAAHTRGRYARLSLRGARQALSGLHVRLGAYGDPAAVPVRVWDTLLADTAGHVGYTHQWRRFKAISRYTMASVESLKHATQAHARGFRTFRIGAAKTRGESLCPASAEAGRKLTCDRCMACSGSTGRRGSIVIPAHGYGKNKIAQLSI
jgi:hypothetical protein